MTDYRYIALIGCKSSGVFGNEHMILDMVSRLWEYDMNLVEPDPKKRIGRLIARSKFLAIDVLREDTHSVKGKTNQLVYRSPREIDERIEYEQIKQLLSEKDNGLNKTFIEKFLEGNDNDQIFTMFLMGYTMKEIGKEIGRTESMVSRRFKNIMESLGIYNFFNKTKENNC